MSLPLGPFRGSSTLLSGLVTYAAQPDRPACGLPLNPAGYLGLVLPAACADSKIPWKLNRTRKANQRQRLASVKEVIEVLRATVPIKALVREGPLAPSPDAALMRVAMSRAARRPC